MKADDVRKVAVIGAGTMGPGIADEFARWGREVVLTEPDADRLAAGLQSIRSAHEVLKGAQLLTPEEGSDALSRLRLTTSLEEACEGADLVVEAITENLEAKLTLFRRLDALTSAHAVLASNTSGLSITQIASAVSNPTRVCGMHFFNPAYVVPLVEIIQGDETTDENAGVLYDICEAMGKQPVRVRRDVPGFIANRLQFAVFREAVHLLETGVATAEDIDRALQAGPGFRYVFMGQLKTADMAGLDVFLAIASYLFADLSNATSPPDLLRQLVERGNTGVKAGRGFFDHADGAGERLEQERDRVLLAVRRLLTGLDEAS